MSRRVFSPDGDRYLEVRKGTDGQFYPHEVSAGNHEILFSGEGHPRKQDAWRSCRAAFPEFFPQPEQPVDPDVYPDHVADEQTGEPW